MSLVGENTNKGCAPNLIIYGRLLVITPTRAVLNNLCSFDYLKTLVGENTNKGCA
jgi:hypothetical protein